MAFGTSKVFRAFLADTFGNNAAFDLEIDACKVALYQDNITPLPDAAAPAYGDSVWVSTGGPTGPGQVFETGQWEQGGQALAGQQLNSGTAGVVFLDATDTASGAAADLSGVVGCLIYDTAVANRGICYLSFGGANSVVNGTLTVIYSNLGIMRATVS